MIDTKVQVMQNTKKTRRSHEHHQTIRGRIAS